MNILAGFETLLYVISSTLFYPVVIGLVLLVFWMVISFGGFLREWIERRQGISMPVSGYKGALEKLVVNSTGERLDIDLERTLQSAELDLVKSLDKVRFVIRVGPALGLILSLPTNIAGQFKAGIRNYH